MPSQRDTEKQVEQTLAALESQLESPVVPGEMRDWLKRIRIELEKVVERYAHHCKAAHQQFFDEIVEQDAGQTVRVEQLRAEDEAIGEELARLVKAFSQAKDQVGIAEDAAQRDEAEFAALLPTLTGDALALVIRIRMQEKALDTWYVEAFQRDRGVAD